MSATMPGTSLPAVHPDAAGFSSKRLARIGEALSREVDAGRIPGGVIGVVRGGKVALLQAVGFRDVTTRAVLAPDALFSIASMTKPMTSVGIMMLVEEGRVLLGDPISAYLPELKNLQVAVRLDPNALETRPAARQPTVQDLLRHTSGFTYSDRGASAAHKKQPGGSIKAMISKSKADTLAPLATAPLLFDPGSNWEYGFSTDVLGFIVEAVSGQTLGAFLKQRLWDPIGMADTAFHMTADKMPRYAHALANDPLTGAKQAVHHATEHAPLWDSGGGGALSSAMDYLRFANMLRAGGVAANGERILGRGTVKLMTANHLPAGLSGRIADSMDPAAAGYGFGLGFAVRDGNGLAAKAGSAGDYYWSGVYGTYFWIDPAEDMAVVFMAAAPGLIRLRYRQMMRNMVYQAIT